MTYSEIEKRRMQLADNTSAAYRKLRNWLEKSVKENKPADIEVATEHVYDAAAYLTSCREEELKFLEDPYAYMNGKD